MIRLLALRELRSLFSMPSTWFALAVLQFIFAWFFLARLDAFLEIQPQLAQLANPPGVTITIAAPLFNTAALLLMMLVPMFTMRLIAEERRSGTIEVLLTSPVTEGQVIAGKFLAALLFYVVLWLPTVIYVALLKQHSSIDLRPVAAGYVGVLLVGFLFLAVGTFTSTLTNNQLIAAILAFAALVGLFSIGLIEQLLVSSSWIRDALGYMNLWTHMDDYAKGIIDTRHVVYELSVGLLFLFLAAKSLEVKKWR